MLSLKESMMDRGAALRIRPSTARGNEHHQWPLDTCTRAATYAGNCGPALVSAFDSHFNCDSRISCPYHDVNQRMRQDVDRLHGRFGNDCCERVCLPR